MINMLFIPLNRINEFPITNGNGRFIEPMQMQEGYGIWTGTLQNPDDAWAWEFLSQFVPMEMTPIIKEVEI